MDIKLEQLLEGKPTIIGKKAYFRTADYVQPFIERLKDHTDDFRIHVQTPDQVTISPEGQDTTYNRIYIEAVIPDSKYYSNHDKVIGMVMGIDVRKPVVKFYSGALNSACTNLCIFNPTHLSVQGLEPETPIDFRSLDEIIRVEDDTRQILEKLHSTAFDNTVEEREKVLGSWIDNAILMDWNNGFQPVKISTDNVISAYKSLFIDDKSPYYQVGSSVNLFDVYNAFTQQITNMVTKGRDVFSIPEKTLLVSRILKINS